MKAGADRLVTLSDPRSPAAEAYRSLRTNIQFSCVDTPPRTLLVTGTEADEGKSTVLCNLAVTIAQAGTRVIVVDCDLRRPSVHEIFGLANDKGLATALVEEGEALPLQQTAVPNLRLLAAGPMPPSPADLLGSQRMRSLIDDLVASADLVLFDGPPVGLFADSQLLASRVDGTILVLTAGKTRREAANRAKALLEKANARILGVVLSNARLDQGLYRYYSSRGR
ncbi:MAG: CpsD/CapB family tyrosine-protein kinase [Sphingomonadaceae bacterium]